MFFHIWKLCVRKLAFSQFLLVFIKQGKEKNNKKAELKNDEKAYLESEEAVLNFEIKYPLIIEGSKDLESLKVVMKTYYKVRNESKKYEREDVPLGYSTVLMGCEFLIPILQEKVSKFNV